MKVDEVEGEVSGVKVTSEVYGNDDVVLLDDIMSLMDWRLENGFWGEVNYLRMNKEQLDERIKMKKVRTWMMHGHWIISS